MIKVKLCYNNDSVLLKEALQVFLKDYPDISFESFNEDNFSERKKAVSVKSPFAARVTPFCGISKDATLKKGFYSEVGECTEENIKSYISQNF